MEDYTNPILSTSSSVNYSSLSFLKKLYTAIQSHKTISLLDAFSGQASRDGMISVHWLLYGVHSECCSN